MNTMINKILGMTLSLVLLVSVVSCSDDDGNDAIKAICTDKTEMTFAAEGGSDKLLVQAGQNWVALATEPWVLVSPANGNGYAECTITVDSSLVSGVRTAEVRFTEVGGATVSVEVNQTGFGKIVSLKEPEINIEASAKVGERFCEAQVTANVPFEVQIEYPEGDEEWLSVEEFDLGLDRGARPRTIKLRFNWKMNVQPEQRLAKINFVPVNETDILKQPAVLTLTQKAAPKIEDNRTGDSLAIVMIAEQLNVMGEIWDTSENLRNWDNVVLWEETDEDLPSEEAVGRIRSVAYSMFRTEESIPQEIRYLKYLETLYLGSNTNTGILSTTPYLKSTEDKSLSELISPSLTPPKRFSIFSLSSSIFSILSKDSFVTFPVSSTTKNALTFFTSR